MLFVATLLFTFSGSVLSREIPSFVHLCRRHDPEIGKCLVKSMNELKFRLRRGIPELNLPSTEPYHFHDITLNAGGTSAVQLNIEIKNGIIFGLTNFNVVSCDKNVDKAHFTCFIKAPFLRMQGYYRMEGKIVLLQVESEGPFDFNITNTDFDGIWRGIVYKKGEKEYTRYETVNLKLEVEGMHIEFEDIFKGNKVLSENTNQVINENIQQLKEDFYPVIKNTVGEISLDFLNRVYDLYSLDQLYPDN